MQFPLIDVEARTARSVARTDRTGAVDLAFDLAFFGHLRRVLFLRALVLAARMTPVYKSLTL